MTLYGMKSSPIDSKLSVAASAAAARAPKVLPPHIGALVITEINLLKESSWASNHDLLRLIIAEIAGLTESAGRAA